MGEQPTLLFCVGATKAGTSWFHRYLEAHPDCHMRSVKELHYFDSLEPSGSHWQLRHLKTKLRTLQTQLPLDSQSFQSLEDRLQDYQELIDLHAMGQDDGTAYLQYLTKGLQREHLVADVTPAYGLLSVDRLAQMACLLPRVRFLYFLRDPVARLWSHIRMLAARRVYSPTRQQKAARRIFWRFGRGRFPDIWARSDYQSALTRLDAALAPGQLHTVFYEDLFSQKAIGKICDFLGVRRFDADLENRVHAGPEMELDQDMEAHAREWLAPQYKFIRNRFTHLPQEWQVNMVGAKA